jgi:hypothetical protein
MTKVDPRILSNAINDWESTAPIQELRNPIAFRKHILNKYGIDVGTFMTECSVADEKKYMMCILRWS